MSGRIITGSDFFEWTIFGPLITPVFCGRPHFAMGRGFIVLQVMSTPLPGKPRKNHVVNPRLPLSANRRASLRKKRNDDKIPTGFTGEFNNLTLGIDNTGTK